MAWCYKFTIQIKCNFKEQSCIIFSEQLKPKSNLLYFFWTDKKRITSPDFIHETLPDES